MLVRYDRDFWDDDRFPFGSCAGVLQLPDIGKNLNFFWSILTGPVRLLRARKQRHVGFKKFRRWKPGASSEH